MEAIAKFDFNASGEDELSFQVGDVLKVSAIQVPPKYSQFNTVSSARSSCAYSHHPFHKLVNFEFVLKLAPVS